MPITEALHKVLFDGEKVETAVESLMARVKTHEMEDLVNTFENQIKWPPHHQLLLYSPLSSFKKTETFWRLRQERIHLSEDLHKIESKSGRAVSYQLGYIVTIVMPEAKPPSLLQVFFAPFSVSKYWKSCWTSGFSYIKWNITLTSQEKVEGGLQCECRSVKNVVCLGINGPDVLSGDCHIHKQI